LPIADCFDIPSILKSEIGNRQFGLGTTRGTGGTGEYYKGFAAPS